MGQILRPGTHDALANARLLTRVSEVQEMAVQRTYANARFRSTSLPTRDSKFPLG